MKRFESDVKRQIYLLYLGATVAAMANSLVTLALRLPVLPIFYAISALIFYVLSRVASLEHFLSAFSVSFLTVLLQSFFTVYILGDDCGIQLYLLALIIPSYYVRMTRYSPAFQRVFIVLVCGACILGYLLSDEIIGQFIIPLTQIDNISQILYTFINVLGSLSMLAFVGNIFVQGYQRSMWDLVRSNHQLEHEVEQDALTGLKNRRGMEPLLERYFDEWVIKGTPLTVGLGDTDLFKQVNDSYGHDTGDLVLSRLGNLLACRIQPPAQVCRWGGEEFLFLLPIPLEQARCQLEGLRRDIERLALCVQEQTLHITMTIGLASADQADTIASLIQRADQKLYVGKQAGRNQVVC